jgi:hypothetical protein
LVLSELLVHVSALLERPLPYEWVDGIHAPADHMTAAEREATAADAFDRLHLKRGVWDAWKAGRATLVSKVLRHTSSAVDLARVTCFLPAGAKEPDWGLWASIFAWFGPTARGKRKGGPWNVIWFAAATPRRFPLVGQDLGPEHVNGGYTRPCSTEGVFIYRAEEATRVLIHELLHAGCMDETGEGWSVPLREAQIEVWAELLLVALISRGVHKTALRLWGLQSQWVADTNRKARADHNTRDIDDYAWRYLCGREVMYARHGIALPPADHARASQMRSVRFTDPALGR